MVCIRPSAWALSVLLAASGALLQAAQPAPAGRLVHEKHVLPNGMTVILHEDHSRPVVAVNVWYAVGSKDEPPGRSGFAHLFEHLMFMGTKRVPGGDFDAIMESAGGWNNATTSFDRTNYYSTGPAGMLPTLLWLEADRLEDLGRMMTQEKLDKQREVVRNERRQSDENRPYGKADLAIDAAMFPLGHPYHFSVIGTHEDLEAATVEDVQDFFATFYVPSNASLVVAGDFDPAAVMPLVARLFGTLSRRPEPPHARADRVELAGVERLILHDDVQLNRVTIAWHSPPLLAPGDADLDVLAGILADGKSSRLWRRLVRDMRLCAEVPAWQSSRELQSIFEIEALCPPETSLDQVEAIIDEEVARLAAEGPARREVERVRNRIEHAKVGALDSLLAVADKLNEYEHLRGEPDSLDWDLQRYAKVTEKSVRAWTSRTCDPERRVVVRVLSEDPRSRPDALADSAAFGFPEPQSWTPPGGPTIFLWERHDLPLVSARLLLPDGALGDGAGRSGLTSLALDMLDEGTADMGAAEFAEALEQLGATMGVDVQREWSTLSLASLSRTFDEAFGLFARAVASPALSEAEWTRVQSLRLDDLRQRDDDPAQLAVVAANRAYFGDADPRAWPADGMVSTVQSLDVAAMRSRAERLLHPQGAALLVAGDIDRPRLEALVARHLGDRFGRWPTELVTFPPPPDAPSEPSGDADRVACAGRARDFRVILVPRPDAVQTIVRFQWPGPGRRCLERLPLRLVNTALGGSFTSRLNQNLREAHGYTYGASSRFVHEGGTGYGIASAAVRSDVTGESLAEFVSEFERLRRDGLSAEELAKAAEIARTSMVDAAEGLDGILGQAVDRIARGESIESFGTEHAWLGREGATGSSLVELARRHVDPRSGILVLVGDETLVRAELEGLDLGPIVVVDPNAPSRDPNAPSRGPNAPSRGPNAPSRGPNAPAKVP